MYKERMELYKRENPNVIFPDFQEIPSEECKSLSLEISKKFLNEAFSGLDLLTQLFKKAVRIENVNAASECFSLIETLQKQEITFTETGYIDWYRLDRTTKMRIQDISSCFEYLYFPSADDIQIFDSSISWLMFIEHDGEVYILR
jgi:hypothetical protein